MAIIPVDMDQVPTSQPPLDESLTYNVVLKKIEVAGKKDKNGDSYFKVACEVTDGDFKGRSVADNYIRIPVAVSSLEATLGRRPTEFDVRQAQEKGIRFAQLVKCFTIPYTAKGIEVQAGVGRTGKVTVKNEEYPEGSGDLRSRIATYLTG